MYYYSKEQDYKECFKRTACYFQLNEAESIVEMK